MDEVEQGIVLTRNPGAKTAQPVDFASASLLCGERFMRTLAHATYLDSRFGVECELPHAGSALENPYVYDASARELKAMAERGLVEIVDERRRTHDDEALIQHLSFRRLR
jgi:hypothetical protein